MPARDLIVIGTSAGGVGALLLLVRELPRDIRAALVAVLHLAPFSSSRLPALLSAQRGIPAANAEDGAILEHARLLVAPPDHHVLIEDGVVRLTGGPRVNRHRPSVDVLFRSAARARGPRVIGVVLTGALDDGASGLASVRRLGGLAVVQAPEDAPFPDMPRSALALAGADHVAPVRDIPALLARLAGQPVEEVQVARKRRANGGGEEPLAAGDGPPSGRPSGYSCPDCGGVLWDLTGTDADRVECRVGHAYSLESLFSSQGDAVEDALWSALRALEEQASLARRLERRALERGQPTSAERFGEQADAGEARARILRAALADVERAAVTEGATPDADAPPQ